VSEKSICIIVLAAGASSRMGEPKQLLKFEGETFLRRSVRAALETRSHPVVVVLGFCADVLREEIVDLDALTVVNQEWQEGMSSSIRCGLRRALESAAPAEIEAAILMLCDQPYVTSSVIERLIDAYREGHAPVVASEYEAGGEKTLGAPALFSRALFPELMALNGIEGAKRIIARHHREAAVVAMPEAAFDVDTPGDYRALSDKESLG
jgi:molybdenum cofactor cytidylyltransferase